MNMASLLTQRDLMQTFKQGTYSNLSLLHSLHPIPADLFRQLFVEDALEKASQHIFINLSHYLICIISPKACNVLPWPLYDSKSERTYKAELANFISRYYNTGMVSPIISSYFVNPACYKVTKFIHQLSQLAVQTVLQNKMTKETHKSMFKDVSAKYKSSDKQNFYDAVVSATDMLNKKITEHQGKKQKMEKISAVLRDQIIANETEYKQKLNTINEIVDGYIKERELDTETKSQIMKIKDIDSPAPYFEEWLNEVDLQINLLEQEWENRMGSFLKLTDHCQKMSESVISRHTQVADRNTYLVEYNREKDSMCTSKLEAVVTSEQRYILKNIIRKDKLLFPNLIRGFVVAICYIFKSLEIGDEVYQFTGLLESNHKNVKDALSAFRVLTATMLDADAKLQPSPIDKSITCNYFLKENQYKESLYMVPPIPDLTISFEPIPSQANNDGYTPINVTRHQFNLRRKHNMSDYVRPQPKFLLTTPFHPVPKDDFLKSVISCQVSKYDRSLSENKSVLSQPQSSRINETVAGINSGFTKQQIMRLLSTKKSSSKKKPKYQKDKEDKHMKSKSSLFNDSNESSGLFRSYSSPNLNDNREKRSLSKYRARQLSVMHEISPSALLEVSGIVTLGKNSTEVTPCEKPIAERTEHYNTKNVPQIFLTPEIDLNLKKDLLNFEAINLELSSEKPVLSEPMKRTSLEKETLMDSPKLTSHPIRKTSSIEKIINRYKRVRATVSSNVQKESVEKMDIKTIMEEKENIANGFNANKTDDFLSNNIKLLPDLLSPGCNIFTKVPIEYLNSPINLELADDVPCRPRESLGTVLGVDSTFLDQFDLID